MLALGPREWSCGEHSGICMSRGQGIHQDNKHKCGVSYIFTGQRSEARQVAGEAGLFITLSGNGCLTYKSQK